MSDRQNMTFYDPAGKTGLGVFQRLQDVAIGFDRPAVRIGAQQLLSTIMQQEAEEAGRDAAALVEQHALMKALDRAWDEAWRHVTGVDELPPFTGRPLTLDEAKDTALQVALNRPMTAVDHLRLMAIHHPDLQQAIDDAAAELEDAIAQALTGGEKLFQALQEDEGK